MQAWSSEPTRVDHQGRTFLPKKVRDALGLTGPGYVVFESDGNAVRVRRVEWRRA